MKTVISLAAHPIVRLVLRLILGGTFVYASIDKVQHPAAFARAVSFYHFLPNEAINAFALLLPWVELVAGAALILGVAARGSALLLGGLNVIFIIALSWAIAKGIDIHCGCFSTSPQEGHKVGYDLVVRDILLLLASFPMIAWGAGVLSVSGLLPKRAPDATSKAE